MKKLIINADDFGLTYGVSYGILCAHLEGVVTSTTALPVSEHFMESMKLAKHVPSLKIGVHLGLTLQDTKPLLGNKVPSLQKEDGTFHHVSDFLNHISLQEVEDEWRAQIERFLSTDIKPTHLDSHHNVHCFTENLFEVAKKLAKEYNLPLRNYWIGNPEDKVFADTSGLKTTYPTDQRFYQEKTTLQQLEIMLKDIQDIDAEVFEINCHPAFVEPHLAQKSGYLKEREVELDLLRSKEVKDLLHKYQITLTTFDTL